jgi:hypothetical protein
MKEEQWGAVMVLQLESVWGRMKGMSSVCMWETQWGPMKGMEWVVRRVSLLVNVWVKLLVTTRASLWGTQRAC